MTITKPLRQWTFLCRCRRDNRRSQREERLDYLENRMKELGLKMEDYWWYLDLRRYGSTRHAGFGLGFERAIMYITGMST